MVEMCEVVNFIRGPLALACQRASRMAASAEYRKYCQRRFPLSFNTMQYFPSAHPRFSSRRSVASASPRLLAMARTLGCLRPSGMFQDFSMRKRSSSVRCDLDLLHFMSSAFLCVFVVSLTVSQKADIFISFFGLARRPPGGRVKGSLLCLIGCVIIFCIDRIWDKGGFCWTSPSVGYKLLS